MEATDVAGAKKKSLREGRTIVFIDESGLSEKCPVTRTCAQPGITRTHPVAQELAHLITTVSAAISHCERIRMVCAIAA